jgi:hypothetical protein
MLRSLVRKAFCIEREVNVDECIRWKTDLTNASVMSCKEAFLEGLYVAVGSSQTANTTENASQEIIRN